MLGWQALADLLRATHRGYFVPPRPEKNPVEGQRAAPNFIEQRRTDMERFLQQLASHPAVGLSRVCSCTSTLRPGLASGWNTFVPSRMAVRRFQTQLTAATAAWVGCSRFACA